MGHLSELDKSIASLKQGNRLMLTLLFYLYEQVDWKTVTQQMASTSSISNEHKENTVKERIRKEEGQ